MKLQDTFTLGLQEATRSGRTIQGVSVHGAVSRNGRRYSKPARQDIRSLIEEGRNQVFADHPDANSEVRPVESLVGVLKRPRLSEDRIKADLTVVDAEPWRSLLPSIAEDMPGAAGLSIRARGSVREAEDGTQVVESVEHLFGTELVTEPATVSGLVESLQRDRRDTVREVLEAEDLDPDNHPDLLLDHLARQPDAEEEAEAYAAEFQEAVLGRDRAPSGGSGGSGGVASQAVERDPDEELADPGLFGRGRAVTDEDVAEAEDRLW